MKIEIKYSVEDKVRFFCDDYQEEMTGVIKVINLSIEKNKGKLKTDVEYIIRGPKRKSSNTYCIKEKDIIKAL